MKAKGEERKGEASPPRHHGNGPEQRAVVSETQTPRLIPTIIRSISSSSSLWLNALQRSMSPPFGQASPVLQPLTVENLRSHCELVDEQSLNEDVVNPPVHRRGWGAKLNPFFGNEVKNDEYDVGGSGGAGRSEMRRSTRPKDKAEANHEQETTMGAARQGEAKSRSKRELRDNGGMTGRDYMGKHKLREVEYWTEQCKVKKCRGFGDDILEWDEVDWKEAEENDWASNRWY